MKFSPGLWSERLLGGAITQPNCEVQNLGDFDEETAAQVMAAAQERVSRFTVVIGNAGVAGDCIDLRCLNPGTGVLVQLDDDVFGVLTAGHVLKRGNNTKSDTSVSIFVPSRRLRQGGDVMRIDLPSRRCTTDGFNNDSEEGPDIAIIPLSNDEWNVLNSWGMVAYNLAKVRWSEGEEAHIEKMNPWMISIINGIRFEASRIIHGHTDGSRGSLAIIATNTQVNVTAERLGHDYLELPSETTKYSRPTQWRNGLPGTAVMEIEDLHGKGVTHRVWSGTSGAGVWNIAVGTTDSGLPNGKVLMELAGICFFANPDKGCVIAHGSKSIAKIAAEHVRTGAP